MKQNLIYLSKAKLHIWNLHLLVRIQIICNQLQNDIELIGWGLLLLDALDNLAFISGKLIAVLNLEQKKVILYKTLYLLPPTIPFFPTRRVSSFNKRRISCIPVCKILSVLASTCKYNFLSPSGGWLLES